MVLNFRSSQAVGSQAPAPSYFTYFWKPIASSEYQSATLVESRTTIESGTTGLKTWRASLVLAQYLIKHPGSCFAGFTSQQLDRGAFQTLFEVETSWSLDRA